MKVAIVGSYTWTDETPIQRYVDKLPATATVVSGGAPGVNTMTELYKRVWCIGYRSL